MEPVLEVRVLNVQLQFNEQMVVLVVRQTKPVALEQLPIRNASVAQEHLAPLLVSVFACLHLERVL